MATHLTFPMNRWEHIALVVDEPDAMLYLNAQQIGSIYLKQMLQRDNINSLTFGDVRRRWSADDDLFYHAEAHKNSRYDWRLPFQPWAGKLDELAMWTRPLTAAEIRGVYAATLARKPVYEAVPVLTIWESGVFRAGWIVVLSLIATVVLNRVLTRQLRRRLSTAESQLLLDAERKRIADNIHDELGARLAKLSLISELAAREGGTAVVMTMELK